MIKQTAERTGMSQDDRFAFGANWSNFGRSIDEARIDEAYDSLRAQLGDLNGLRFVDVGCGSGLFSLAALRLGAKAIYAFDYDDDSVRTTRALLERCAPSGGWTVERGDVLDPGYVRSLGEADVVYSWGVLHHTGNMAEAWANVATLVAPTGRLFISIYNDQGWKSLMWTKIKRSYARVPPALRSLYVVLIMAPGELVSAAFHGPREYVRLWKEYKHNRGMSRWHDLVDWVGGYPFEVAKPEEVFDFFRDHGYSLEWMSTCAGHLGCNQFVLRRNY